ncbi:unnamed protein product [Rotaria socialis]|uniref:EIF-4F 25 kDa subunit n=1 Tax=Rotaria socialis TaxID=392032 RepID=A0A821RKW3_9BILA|nr:unnamed protein product [Rotaria socialis]CAF4843218.1 unnamed protein product [Rotaria socialis]
MSTDEFYSDRNDSQSDETYATPISPLSPQEKSPPPPPSQQQQQQQQLLPSLLLTSITSLNEEKEDLNSINEMQTLMQSSNDLTFPLEDSWTFWYFKNDRMCDWKDNLIQITTISTVEAFWSVYNHLQSASRLGQGCDYFLFKTHIQPMWEDRYNRSGGRWCLNLNKSQRTNELDTYWLHTLLSLIGDQYGEDAHNVNGCVVSVRSKGDRISLWTRDWRSVDVTKRIGSRFREVADIPRSMQLIFEVSIIIHKILECHRSISHEDQESKRGASSKILFRA